VTDAPAGLTHIHSGKVRDLYRTDDGSLVMLATDRVSAYDFILQPEIPDKGRILTAMTVWWFEQLADVVPNHMISVDSPSIPADWRGRAMLCTPLTMLPVEAVARGYLAGSGVTEYNATGSVCGVQLPAGLVDGDRLPQPIFTPATKAAVGDHDENIDFDRVVAEVGHENAEKLRTLTLSVYTRASQIAAERGIILADTKFEFGLDSHGTMLLGDEVLTPDSSRFWPADLWKPGQTQPSYDKQYIRDWLTSADAGWDRAADAPPPGLPARIVEATRERYIEAYERLTGLRFSDWLAPDR
jgi:phosphoribosylaminoimidazole-succinocarboxamide synthase